MDQTLLISMLVFLLVAQAILLAGTASYSQRERVVERLDCLAYHSARALPKHS